MKLITFVRSYEGNIKGDLAGFQDETADRIVAAGYAHYANGESAPVNEDIEVKGTPKLSELICPICGKEAKTKAALAKHRKSHDA